MMFKSRPAVFQHIKGFLRSLLFLVLLIPFSAASQGHDVGLTFGGMYYLGDLNPQRQFSMTRVAAGGLFRYNFSQHIAVRLTGLVGSVQGDDAVVGYNLNRNLSFRSNLVELSLQGEVNFLPYETGRRDTPHSPYLFAGIGGVGFNPRAAIEGTYHQLQPLGTEGQGLEGYPDPYSRFTTSILMGVGYKFNITRRISAGLEWGFRRTGTDYLDDVSTVYPADFDELPQLSRDFSDRSLQNQGNNAGYQRGNPTTNDWYSFAGFFLSFKLPGRRPDCPAFN